MRVDYRSDIFSLGVVLFEAISGQPPFSRPSTIETLNAIIREDPPDLPVGAGELGARTRAHRAALSREIARFALSVGAGHRLCVGRHIDPIRYAWGGLEPGADRPSSLRTRFRGIGGDHRNSTRRDRPRRNACSATDGPGAARELRGSRTREGAFQGMLGVSSVISPDGATLAMAVTTKSGARLFLRALRVYCSTARRRQRGRLEPLLVARQPLAGLLCGREDEADRRGRGGAADHL